MSKKLLKQLINYSYKENILSVENVNKVASLLSRKDLRYYLKGLKIQERKVVVFIDVPMNNIDIKDKLRGVFPNKKIVLNIDPSLILGVKIIDDDMLFEVNVKNSLNKILSYIEQDYD